MFSATVQRLIEQLGLLPHPEGGYYKETFRDEGTGPDGRSHSTAILYLLPAGARSKLHRLDASECWHHYVGGPLRVVELGPDSVHTTVLGSDLAAGQTLQHVVPPHTWFGAEPSQGTEFALVGCTVAPAFLFDRFEMGDRKALLAQFPHARDWIERLLGAGGGSGEQQRSAAESR